MTRFHVRRPAVLRFAPFLALIILPAMLVAAPVGAQFAPIGPAILPHPTVDGWHAAPSVLAAPEGYAMSWWVERDGVGKIFLRSFDFDGRALGPARLAVGPTSDGVEPYDPVLAVGAGGTRILLWELPEVGTFGRLFGPDGTALGGRFKVGGPSSPGGVAVCVDAAGDFVVARLNGGDEILLRRYNAAAVPLDNERRVEGNARSAPAVVCAPEGSFAVVWTRNDGKLRLARFDSDGARLAPPRTIGESSIGARPRLARAADGRLAVLWGAPPRVLVLDADGAPSSAAQLLWPSGLGASGVTAAIFADAGGGFLALWTVPAWSAAPDGARLDLLDQASRLVSRRFDAFGRPLGGVLSLGTLWGYVDEFEVAALGGGSDGLAMAWSGPFDGDGPGIFARFYRVGESISAAESILERERDSVIVGASGDLLTKVEIEIDEHLEYGATERSAPALALADDGTVLVGWVERAAERAEDGVWAQRFTPDGEPLEGRFSPSFDFAAFPEAVAGPDGFALLWQHNTYDDLAFPAASPLKHGSGNSEILVQRTLSTHGPWSAPYLVHSGPGIFHGPRLGPVGIACRASGGFVVLGDLEGLGMVGALELEDDLDSLGPPTLLLTRNLGPASMASARAADGGQVVWPSAFDGDGPGISAASYGELSLGKLSLGKEIPLTAAETAAEGNQERPRVVALADGTYLAVWQSLTDVDRRWRVVGRRLDGGGRPLGSVFALSAEPGRDALRPAVAAAPDGTAMVVWESRPVLARWRKSAAPRPTIRALRVDASGDPLGPPFELGDGASTSFAPSTAASAAGYAVAWRELADGRARIVLVWISRVSTPSSASIRSR